jgi:hypothetical protein
MDGWTGIGIRVQQSLYLAHQTVCHTQDTGCTPKDRTLAPVPVTVQRTHHLAPHSRKQGFQARYDDDERRGRELAGGEGGVG